MQQYALSVDDATQLTSDPVVADYFEQVVAQSQAPAKIIANWINGEIAAALHKAQWQFKQLPISIMQLAQLLDRISDKTISGKIAKHIFEQLWQKDEMPDEIIAREGLTQISDSHALEKIIDAVIQGSPKQVAQFQAGKDKILGYFVGQVMKQTQGKANPAQVNELLREKLTNTP